MTPAEARRRLIRQLQGAYSGERAAGHAYAGHWRASGDPGERSRIREIEAEEWQHRRQVGEMLQALGAQPSRWREVVFLVIGGVLGPLCHLTPWFFPMWGAGRLERGNVGEYEVAARYAVAAGHPEMVDCLLEMAEVEWEHERYFRERIAGHPLLKLLPLWPALPEKRAIRARHREAA